MSSPFAALEDGLSEACDTVFGERFEFRPMIYGPGGGKRLPDPSRTAATVTAIFEAPLYKSTEFGTEARGSAPALIEKTSVSIAAPALGAYGQPKRFDIAKRLATGDLFEVSTIERDAEGRYKIGIKQIGHE